MNTKNWFTPLLAAGVFAGGLALTSCEDDFTEADAIAAQDSTLIALKRLENQQEKDLALQEDSLERIGAKVSYNVTVLDAGSDNSNARTEGEASAEGVTVTLVQGGQTHTGTTNAGGVATFADLRIGEASVTLEKADHTTVTYTTNLGDPNSDLAEDIAGTTVPIFPTTVATGASEISGKVWAELNLTNDMPEPAEGAIVRANISVGDALGAYGISTGSTKGQIKSISYSNFIIEATVDAEGNYTMVVPNGNADNGDGLFDYGAVDFDFLPFEADQTLVVEQGDSLAVVTRRTLFDPNQSASSVDLVPSVSVEIAAPVNTASGFELGTKANRSLLSTYSAIDLVSGGSGYAPDDEIIFAEDADGNQAGVVVGTVDGSGKILSLKDLNAFSFGLQAFNDDITVTGTSAIYDAEPAVASTSGSGTGASFDLRFQTTYKVFITNRGSGYFNVPTVTGTAMDYSGSSLISVVDNDLNNSSYGTDLSDRWFDDATIIDGSIVPTGSDADTIFTTGALASAPTVEVMAPEVRTAVVDFNDLKNNRITNSGEITNIFLSDAGEGYTAAPAVTIKGLGSMGTGATAIATISSNGTISDIVVTNGGSGFVRNINNTNDKTNAFAAQLTGY